jgi:hypothetical protein
VTHAFRASFLDSSYCSLSSIFGACTPNCLTLSLLILTAAFGIPAIFSKLPMSLINLPHREYWLAPERRAETLAFLDSSFAWFGCVVLLVVIDAVNYAIGRNLHPGAQLDPPVLIYVLGGFFVFTILWSIRLLTHFGQIPRDGLAPK